MGDVVNLNKYRKERARAESRGRAAGNRVRHGRSKAERKLADAERERGEKMLDRHLKDSSEDEPPAEG